MKTKITGLFENIILAILIIILGLAAFSKITTNQATIFGYRPFFIISGSMEPGIPTGSFVLCKACNGTEVTVGDVAAYKADIGPVILHRIISEENNNYIFKGDANQIADNPVSKDKVLYKLVWPKIGGQMFTDE